jgi:hypothetical protein
MAEPKKARQTSAIAEVIPLGFAWERLFAESGVDKVL